MSSAAKRYLITGFSGFVSAHFIEHINGLRNNADVLGVDISEPDFEPGRYNNINIEFSMLDLLDTGRVKEAILKFRPDFVLHLASFSSVAFSWKNPVVSFRNNTNIFLNLLEALRETGMNCRVLSIGSSEEYGIEEKSDIPLSESAPLHPVSPYAAARVSQELLSMIYSSGYGLDIVMTRSFNHFGPGQKDIFAVPSFAKQLTRIKKQNRKEGILHVGNPDVVRDFIDVRDVVKAYYRLLENGRNGQIYNVCAGRNISIREIIGLMADYLGVKVELRTENSLIRPNDNPVIVGNNKKIRDELGWQPEIPMEKSIADICDYWMERDEKDNAL
ncbi:MAG: GDP-mannose 4,6-dehydratase [Candidatus Omnitrophica bacterium]|nr:GDP-mannose 4,6-dehydratase [Candidatus Omnitrophota bacterium]